MGLQRHPGLHPLSEQHHQGLVQARRLRHAGAPDSAWSLREIAEGFIRFWNAGGREHFRKEEEVLLPVYSTYAEVNTVEIINMLLQHIDLRRRARALQHALEAGAELSPDEMQEFGERFLEHIRHEERVVFPMMEKEIPDETLRLLADLFH